jgi:hypothetical protein
MSGYDVNFLVEKSGFKKEDIISYSDYRWFFEPEFRCKSCKSIVEHFIEFENSPAHRHTYQCNCYKHKYYIDGTNMKGYEEMNNTELYYTFKTKANEGILKTVKKWRLII